MLDKPVSRNNDSGDHALSWTAWNSREQEVARVLLERGGVHAGEGQRVLARERQHRVAARIVMGRVQHRLQPRRIRHAGQLHHVRAHLEVAEPVRPKACVKDEYIPACHTAQHVGVPCRKQVLAGDGGLDEMAAIRMIVLTDQRVVAAIVQNVRRDVVLAGDPELGDLVRSVRPVDLLGKYLLARVVGLLHAGAAA